jgi:hypothetical protein
MPFLNCTNGDDMPMTATPPQTIGKLLALAVERHGERVAVRHRHGDGWQEVDDENPSTRGVQRPDGW